MDNNDEPDDEFDLTPPPFIFKFPMGSMDEIGNSNVDLKWLGEQSKNINDLFQKFLDVYNELITKGKNYPPELLKSHFSVIKALSEYQIVLFEQQNKRKGYIQSESEIQEMMNQLEHFVKTFRDYNK